MEMDVEELARRLGPRMQYPANSKFGERVWTGQQAKRHVASYIALKLLQGCQEVFIADGSTGLWLMLAILELDLKLLVLTNNAAVGMERVLRHGSQVGVIAAEGEYNSDYAGIFGVKAEQFCEEAAKNAQYAIMPVTGLTFDHGPCAGNSDARRIKQAVIPTARELVLISDVYKMGGGRNQTSLVFSGRDNRIWCEALHGGYMHVISDRPANGLPPGPPSLWAPDTWNAVQSHPTPEELHDFRNLQAFGRETCAFSRVLRGRLHLVAVPDE